MLRTVKILILSLSQLTLDEYFNSILTLDEYFNSIFSKGVVLYMILKLSPLYKDFSFVNFEIKCTNPDFL